MKTLFHKVAGQQETRYSEAQRMRVWAMPMSYEHVFRSAESLSRAEQLRLISKLADEVRLEELITL